MTTRRTRGWKLTAAALGFALVASCGLESGGALPSRLGPEVSNPFRSSKA